MDEVSIWGPEACGIVPFRSTTAQPLSAWLCRCAAAPAHEECRQGHGQLHLLHQGPRHCPQRAGQRLLRRLVTALPRGRRRRRRHPDGRRDRAAPPQPNGRIPLTATLRPAAAAAAGSAVLTDSRSAPVSLRQARVAPPPCTNPARVPRRIRQTKLQPPVLVPARDRAASEVPRPGGSFPTTCIPHLFSNAVPA